MSEEFGFGLNGFSLDSTFLNDFSLKFGGLNMHKQSQALKACKESEIRIY